MAEYANNSFFVHISDPNDSIAPVTPDNSIKFDEKVQALEAVISTMESNCKDVCIFDLKLFVKILYMGLSLTVSEENKFFSDPKVTIELSFKVAQYARV